MRQRVTVAVAVMITCGVLGACGAVEGYHGDPGTRGATLSGQIHAVGPLPKLDPIPVCRDNEVCGELMSSAALLVEDKINSLEGGGQSGRGDARKAHALRSYDRD